MSQKIEQMLEQEITRLQGALATLRGTGFKPQLLVPARREHAKRRISAAGIEKIRQAQKKRWAKQRRARQAALINQLEKA